MKKKSHDVTIPMTEMRVLKELEEILQASALLESRDSIPVQQHSQGAHLTHEIDILVENQAVVALSVRYSTLTVLPSSINQFSSLRELDLTGNLLTALPDWLGNLPSLQKLYLNGNQLTTLPETLFSLTNLETLHLYGNHLATLSENLGQLTHLKDLSLGHNQLTTLPEALGKISLLQTGLRLHEEVYCLTSMLVFSLDCVLSSASKTVLHIFQRTQPSFPLFHSC